MNENEHAFYVQANVSRKEVPATDAKLDPGEWQHLVKVHAMQPEWDGVIDVWLRGDPEYAHALLTREQYLYYLDRSEIERDAETGYPVYTGSERLRDK